MNPYRKATGFFEDSSDNRDLTLVLALLFVASLIRVIGALVLGETFGAEATLAALVVGGGLVLAGQQIVRRARR